MSQKHRFFLGVVFVVVCMAGIFSNPIVTNAASGTSAGNSPFSSQNQSELFFLPIITYKEANEHGTCGTQESFGLGTARAACRLANFNGQALCYSTITTPDCLLYKGGSLTSSQLLELGQILSSKTITDVPLMAADALYQEKPTSGIIYAQEMFDKITNPGKVYAQKATPYYPGLGFNLLSPIRSIWGWSTTFVYSFMIIIILGIAFSLLFQNALSGKQVVQLSTAIPNVVIAMVLIPLSYPIAGFAIDFLALGSNLAHGVILSGNTAIAKQYYDADKLKIQGGAFGAFTLFGARPGDEAISNTTNRGLYIDDSRISIWRAFTLIDTTELGSIFGGTCEPGAVGGNPADCPGITANVCAISGIQSLTEAAENGDTRAQGILDQIKSAPTLNDITRIMASNGVNDNRGAGCTVLTVVDAALKIVGQVVQSFGGSVRGVYTIDSFLGDIIYVILTFAAFFTTFRIFVSLFIKYVGYFLLMPMISPFLFASVAIPGQGTKGVMFMVKRMYGTALIFIVVYAAFLMAVVLSQGDVLKVDSAVANKFVPPLLGLGGSSAVSNGITGISLNFEGILDLAAMGIFFGIPSLIKYFEDLFGLKIELPTAIKASIGGVGAGVALGAGFARRSVGTVQSAFESARAADEKIFTLRQRFGTTMTRSRDTMIRKTQGIGAVTQSQRLEEDYKTQLRELAREKAEIEGDESLSSIVAARRMADVNGRINRIQNQAKINLGEEIKVVLADGINPGFVGPGGRGDGSSSGFTFNINTAGGGKIVFTSASTEANRIFGKASFFEGTPDPLTGKNLKGTDILKLYSVQQFTDAKGNVSTGVDKKIFIELKMQPSSTFTNKSGEWLYDFGPAGKSSGADGGGIDFTVKLSPDAETLIKGQRGGAGGSKGPKSLTFAATDSGGPYRYTFIFQPPGKNSKLRPFGLSITVTSSNNFVAS